MSVYTNAKEFWAHFLEMENSLKECLKTKNYEVLNPLVEELDDMALAYTGCHFFVENLYDDFECTFDTGPNKTSQYLAQYFVDMAPSIIKNTWILNASLPPLSSKAVMAGIQIKDTTYYLSDFYVFYEVAKNQPLLDCKVYCPGYSLIENPEHKKEMSMYLLELAIGECAYEAYLASVDFIDQPDENKKFCNLTDFYETILNLVDEHHWKEYNSALDIYSVYQPIQDFAHDSLRKDMKFIFTTHPNLIEETIENKTDVLSDLKVKDGAFGYVYYSNPFGTQEDAKFRQELSKKIDSIFVKEKCAKVIGGAIGKSYSYIDVIVFDTKRFDTVFASVSKQLKNTIELHYQSFLSNK